MAAVVLVVESTVYDDNFVERIFVVPGKNQFEGISLNTREEIVVDPKVGDISLR